MIPSSTILFLKRQDTLYVLTLHLKIYIYNYFQTQQNLNFRKFQNAYCTQKMYFLERLWCVTSWINFFSLMCHYLEMHWKYPLSFFFYPLFILCPFNTPLTNPKLRQNTKGMPCSLSLSLFIGFRFLSSLQVSDLS